jgi:hypothetical protein
VFTLWLSPLVEESQRERIVKEIILFLFSFHFLLTEEKYKVARVSAVIDITMIVLQRTPKTANSSKAYAPSYSGSDTLQQRCPG